MHGCDAGACSLARDKVSGVYGGVDEVFQATALTITLKATLGGCQRTDKFAVLTWPKNKTPAGGASGARFPYFEFSQDRGFIVKQKNERSP